MASGSQLLTPPTPLVPPPGTALGQAQGKDTGHPCGWPHVSPKASRLRLMLFASSISSPRDPVAATFSLPARSTKHIFPAMGGSPGSPGGICEAEGSDLGGAIPTKVTKPKRFPLLPPAPAQVACYIQRQTLAG